MHMCVVTHRSLDQYNNKSIKEKVVCGMRVFISKTIPSVGSFNDIFLSYLSICNLYSAADRDKPLSFIGLKFFC